MTVHYESWILNETGNLQLVTRILLFHTNHVFFLFLFLPSMRNPFASKSSLNWYCWLTVSVKIYIIVKILSKSNLNSVFQTFIGWCMEFLSPARDNTGYTKKFTFASSQHHLDIVGLSVSGFRRIFRSLFHEFFFISGFFLDYSRYILLLTLFSVITSIFFSFLCPGHHYISVRKVCTETHVELPAKIVNNF